VTGGVVSGLGKGITISSIGRILKSSGISVTSIKIDPYLNVDAGTMSPFEHGETFVLDDGGETDLDLGNYERFLDITLSGRHNITTGKVYKEVIHRERRGDYLGKTVQIVPHGTDKIQEWIAEVSQKPVDRSAVEPDVCLIEVGGTVGDIESMVFLEALRQFQFKVGRENCFFVHVSLVPVLGSVGEQKTKPTQHSVKELRALGLSPDMIVVRSQQELEESTKKKLGVFCQVAPENTLSVHDVSNIYHVPLILVQQGLHRIIKRHLGLTSMLDEPDLKAWTAMAKGVDETTETIKIALVGKYNGLSDAYLSVLKALTHSGIHLQVKVDVNWVDATNLEEETNTSKPAAYAEAWKTLKAAAGVLVPGGFGHRGVEGKIRAARYCRENKVPYLGVCLGMQVMVIEYLRNVVGREGANSEEFEEGCAAEKKAIVFMPEIDATAMGGTMRLGSRPTTVTTKLQNGNASLASAVYHVKDEVVKKAPAQLKGDHTYLILERHRHRYEVNPTIVADIESKGLFFTGKDEKGERMEIAEMDTEVHPFFFGVQFHPEFKSRPNRPSPPFFAFVAAAITARDAETSTGTPTKNKKNVRPRGLSDAGKLFQAYETATSPHKRARKNHIERVNSGADLGSALK
jgi:CTP synthase